MKRNHLPTEFVFYTDDDTEFRVRFDYDRGESQWFDAMAGVGSPGYDPCAMVTEVNFGAGWEDPEAYPQLNINQIESEILERLAGLESEEMATRDEAEYNARNERV